MVNNIELVLNRILTYKDMQGQAYYFFCFPEIVVFLCCPVPAMMQTQRAEKAIFSARHSSHFTSVLMANTAVNLFYIEHKI